MMSCNDFILTAVIAVCGIAAYCTMENADDVSHKKRIEAFSDRYMKRLACDSSFRNDLGTDTVVFISGVEYHDDYDWRKDSLYGQSAGKIVLFRNGKKHLEIEAGERNHISTDPDMHYLVGGHIFTEYRDRNGTYIGCDGQNLFSFPEREIVRGLVIIGEDVFTLGQNADGEGFSLRKNGLVTFSRERGYIAGQMSDSQDFPSGALYLDSGHLYFSYWRAETSGSRNRTWFIVEDACETQVLNGDDKMYDIRIRNGEKTIIPLVAPQAVFVQYNENGKKATVISYSDGTMLISNNCVRLSEFTEEKYLFFSFRNSCIAWPVLYLAITPEEEGRKPLLWKNGDVSEIDINGFLTGIEVSIVPRQSP